MKGHGTSGSDLELPTLDVERILTTTASTPLYQPLDALPSRGQQQLGESRQGRPIFGWHLGTGLLRVSLIAGCHADEPVGPAMLERLVAYLASLPADAPELTKVSWCLVPHANPDGDAANAAWREALLPAAKNDLRRGYDLNAYLDGAIRELPGDDVEFGFPSSAIDTRARPENRAIASFLRTSAEAHGPFALHASFHGMAFAAGPWFLVEATWAGMRVIDEPGPDRTLELRRRLRETVENLGYRLHDVDRGGEKGFFRIEEGFCTRPDSRAMRTHFEARGEPELAARFRPSSMEFVRALGAETSVPDPLTLVSEMPLFLLPAPVPASNEPDKSTLEMPDPTGTEGMARFKLWLHQRRRQATDAAAFRADLAAHGVVPMPLDDQMRLQLAFLNEGLRASAPSGIDA